MTMSSWCQGWECCITKNKYHLLHPDRCSSDPSGNFAEPGKCVSSQMRGRQHDLVGDAALPMVAKLIIITAAILRLMCSSYDSLFWGGSHSLLVPAESISPVGSCERSSGSRFSHDVPTASYPRCPHACTGRPPTPNELNYNFRGHCHSSPTVQSMSASEEGEGKKDWPSLSVPYS